MTFKLSRLHRPWIAFPVLIVLTVSVNVWIALLKNNPISTCIGSTSENARPCGKQTETQYFDLGFNLHKVLNPPSRSFGRGGAGQGGNDKKPSSMEDVSQAMRSRMKILRQRCSDLGFKAKGSETIFDTGAVFLKNKRNKILMCAVQKAAMSNWKMTFLALAGLVNASDPLYHALYKGALKGIGLLGNEILRRADDVGINVRDVFDEKSKISARSVEGYVTWFQVRHPFERLLSCYRNKIMEDPAGTPFREEILWSREKKRKCAGSFPPDPTFSEFVDYVLERQHERPDSHFQPITQLCEPCRVPYDYMVTYENLDKDAQFVLQAARVGHLISFPARQSAFNVRQTDQRSPLDELMKNKTGYGYTNREKSTVELFQKEYRTLTLEQIIKLYELYKNDFYLFGYA